MARVTSIPDEWSPALQPPPGQRRFPALDGLRGVAALGVVASHASALDWETTWWGPFAFTAGSTVFIFFALSGFLLYRPFVSRRSKGAPPPRVADYTRRRLLRIIPAYWVALPICALFLGFPGAFGNHWYAYWGFIQIYNWRWMAFGGLPHVWTLCIEMSFYLFLPIFAWLVGRALARRKHRWLQTEVIALVALIGTSFALRIAGVFGWVSLRWFGYLPGLMDFFAVGMCLAVLSVAIDSGRVSERGMRRLRMLARPGWIVGLGIYVMVTLVWGPADGSGWMIPMSQFKHSTAASLGIEIGHRVSLMVLSSSLVLWAMLGNQRNVGLRALSSRPLVFCGAISYAIYLWHVPILRWWTNQSQVTGVEVLGNHTLTVLSVGLPLTVLAASISYRVVELPFLNRKEVGATPAPAPAAHPAHERQPEPAPARAGAPQPESAPA